MYNLLKQIIMKKRLLLLLFAAMATALPSLADYIKVSNREMSLDESWSKPGSYFNNTNIYGNVSWNATTRTLTLKDLRMWRAAELNNIGAKNCILVDTKAAITIEVKGKNDISTMKGQVMALSCNTTFTGDGQLILQNADDKKPCIDLMEENLTVTLDGPELILQNANGGLRGKNNTGTLHLKSGKMRGAGEASNPYGKLVIGMGNVIYDQGMGVKQPHGASFNWQTHSMVDKDGNEIKGEGVSFGPIKWYGIRIYGIEITENNYDLISTWNSVRSGNVNYDPQTNILKLDGATLNNQSVHATIDNYDNDGLRITFKGKNNFTFSGNRDRKSMYLRKNTIIEGYDGTGSLTVSGEDSDGGIYVASSKMLTVKNVTLNVPSLVGGNAYCNLHVGDGVEINASGNSQGTVRSLNVVNVSSKPGVAVKSDDHPHFIWNTTAVPGVYTYSNLISTDEVRLSTKNVTWVPIYICGQQVNSENSANIASPYIQSGSDRISYSDGILYLSKVNLEYDGSEPVIMSTEEQTIILLKGNNHIKCGSNDAILANGLGISGKPYGSSTLIIEGENAKVTTKNELFITEADARMPEVTTDKQLSLNNSKLSITRKLDAPKTYLTDVKVASSADAPAYYITDKMKAVGVDGSINFVPSSEVTVYPGIKFCGEEVNSANADCLITKDVKSGYMAVKKTSDGDYSIEMNNLLVNAPTDYPVFSFLNTVETADLIVNGSNQFNFTDDCDRLIESEASSIYLKGGSSSDASFIAKTSSSDSGYSGAIVLGGDCYLHVAKANANSFNVTVPCIWGNYSKPNKLIVESPYLTLTGQKNGTACNVNCIIPNGALTELDLTDEPTLNIKDDGIYKGDELYTGEVRFVKKGEGYVPVEKVIINSTSGSTKLTRKGQTLQLAATVEPANATNKAISWWSDKESVATVDENGKVTARGNGVASIYAWPYGNQVSYDPFIFIEVDIPQPTAVTLSCESSEFDPATGSFTIDREGVGAIYLRANLTPTDAETEYTWTSSNPDVLSVRADQGRVALVRRVADEGEATITVETSNGLTASIKGIVQYKQMVMADSVVFDVHDDWHFTAIGQTMKIGATVFPENATDKSLTWYTGNPRVVTVDEQGKVTTTGYGSTKVAAFTNDGSEIFKSITVHVDEPPVIATGLSFKTYPTFYQLGEVVFLSPVFTPENVTNKTLTWQSSDEAVATVNEYGMVTTVGWGTCYIRATTTDGSNISENCWIEVIDPSTIEDPVNGTGIELAEHDVTMLVGQEINVSISFTPANYNGNVMVEYYCENGDDPISIAEGRTDWDWNANRPYLVIRSDENMGKPGDINFVVRMSNPDWETLNAQGIWTEPADTIHVHVVEPLIFHDQSPEGIDICYRVPEVGGDECEVYGYYNDRMPELDPELPGANLVTPAVDTNTRGKLTVPSRAKGYSVTRVGMYAFQKCSGLTEIEFSEGIRTIDAQACYRALFSLQCVTLPSTIEELGSNCFSGNTDDYVTSEDPSGDNNIREVNIKSFLPPTGTNGYSIDMTNAFGNVADDAVLYVPTGALQNYNVQPWTTWFSRIEEKPFFMDPDGIKDIEHSPLTIDHSWYDMSGRKLSGKPAQRGLYIMGGKKVVIK